MTSTVEDLGRGAHAPLESPADSDALFKEARRRRRRRRLAAIAVVAAVVAIGLAIFALTRGGRGAQQKAATATTAARHVPAAAPVPAFYVRHAPTATGAPGSIDVVETSSGRVIRSLGTEYDPYPENGFVLSADRSTVYYTHLDEPAQKVETLSVPVAGGPTNVVPGLGATGLQFSPDGRKASFPERDHAISIVGLGSGATVTVPLPTANVADQVVSSSWLPDSRSLLVTIQAPNLAARSCPPIHSCSTPPPPPPAVAYVLDTSAHDKWSPLPRPSGTATAWDGLFLQGPGPTAGTVLATSQDNAGNEGLLTIRIPSGRVVSRVALPPTFVFLARDRSATHILISNESTTENWSPTSGTVESVGSAASEASW